MIVRKISAGVIMLGLLLTIGVFTAGCGGKEEVAQPTVGPQATPVGPTGPGAAVPGPTSAAPPPGTATSPVQPSAAGTTATSGSTTAQPDSSAVPFSKAPIASSVKRITLSMGDAKMDFLQFRYVNSQGVACIAEMPAAEAEAKKSPQDWLVTFDLYKKGEVPKTTKTKKNPVKPLSDFPFVSPPPTPGASNNSSPR